MLKQYILGLNLVKRKIFEMVLNSIQHIANMHLSLDWLDGNYDGKNRGEMEKISIYSCRAISAVVKTRNFTKAAQLLNLTPSAVSHLIKKTENDLGYSLFIRNNKGALLTENGKLLLPYIQSLILTSNTLDSEIEKISNLESGVVRVGAFYSVTAYWLPKIIRLFKTKYPDIEINVSQSGDSTVKEWINNQDIDLAFISKVSLDNSELFLPLHNSTLVCVTPEEYVPADGANMTLEDLKGQPLILQYVGYDTEITTYFSNNNLPLGSNYRVEVDDAALALVEEGLGFFISPEMAVKTNKRRINIYPMSPQMSRTVGIVTVSPEHITPTAKLFRQFVYDYMDESGLLNV